MAPPFREVEFDVMYGEGISMLGELVDLGVKYGFVEKSGSWYSTGETRIGQGRDAAKQYLKDNPAFAEKLEADIRASLSENSNDSMESYDAVQLLGSSPEDKLAG